MASVSDDENIIEETHGGGRRTRQSTRNKTPPILTPTKTRSTRRSTRKAAETDLNDEQEPKLDDESIESTELTFELSENHKNDHIVTTDANNVIVLDDEKSSSFPFGTTIQSDPNIMFDQSSCGGGAENESLQQTDSIDFLANLVEDNANSLPSAGDATEFAINLQSESEKDNDENNSNNSSNPYSDMVPDKMTTDVDDAKSDVDIAIAEDLQNGDNSQDTRVEADTEMVSEDELPAPSKEKVDDAEELSDDELPGPNAAELPEDTEVVSEDELPALTKSKRKVDEGYDPGSPTESSEIPEKKAKSDEEETDGNKDENSNDADDKDEKDKKTLPDLDKYWKTVNDDPADFTGWTYLLQYVDQENDIEAARKAYDAFLAHYPYCYGYWRKYADYEKRKGNKEKCDEVFERGLKAIPLSVDLWIHYLTHVKSANVDNEEFIRSQFERALTFCGLEFRSDKLWEAFIKWETESKRMSNVVKIYDKLLATPTQGYNGHFDSFQEIVNNNPILSLVSIDEFKRHRAEYREFKNKDVAAVETEDPSIAPGEEEPDDHVRNDEETLAIKDLILATRRKIHKATVTALTARWTFEEGIKRPYFHVKPLERCQLKNWKDYLDFEIEQGDRERILVLFERCLIACALYDEFWLKLIRYLESQMDPELLTKTREAYERACTIHHPDKPSLHLMWSSFEECHENATKAAEILTNLDTVCPNLLQVAYRRINLERRQGNLDKCDELYEHYISTAKNKSISGNLAIKYARFLNKIKGNIDAGLVVLKTALDKDPANTRVALQMIDLALQRQPVNETEVIEIMDNFMARDGIELDQKVFFAQRKLEFLEDFGSCPKALQDAQRSLQTILTKANEAKKKNDASSATATATVKKATKDSTQTSTSGYGNSYNSYGSSSGGGSNYYNSIQYGSQPYSDSYGYNQWSQYGSNYSNYNQWSGYGSSGYY